MVERIVWRDDRNSTVLGFVCGINRSMSSDWPQGGTWMCRKACRMGRGLGSEEAEGPCGHSQ